MIGNVLSKIELKITDTTGDLIHFSIWKGDNQTFLYSNQIKKMKHHKFKDVYKRYRIELPRYKKMDVEMYLSKSYPMVKNKI